MIVLEKCYVYRNELEKEPLLNLFKERIQANSKFQKEINDEQMTITNGFLVYPRIEGEIKNLEYLIIKDKSRQTGVIDASCNLISKDFLLRQLSTKDFKEEDHPITDYMVFNSSDIEFYQKEFIKRILDKTTKSICQRHNLILTNRCNSLDISPIKTFEKHTVSYYLEEVYFFDYFSKKHHKPFKSLYSPLQNDFYFIDFKKTEEYSLFYKQFKRPIVSIPKPYVEQYYDIAYQIYLTTKEELQYMKPMELYYKIKKNVKYEEYSKHDEYLNQLIFYFKKPQYLKEFKKTGNRLEQEIFYDYLTLKHNPQSGYQLASYVLNHIIDDNFLKLYDISAKLGNTLAKKALYEYYSDPKTYNATYIKRYS